MNLGFSARDFWLGTVGYGKRTFNDWVFSAVEYGIRAGDDWGWTMSDRYKKS